MNIETANRLLKYRKRYKLSQEELAEKIGVSRQAISKWERAEASPDTDNLILLAKLYGVTLDELLMSDVDDIDNEQNGESRKNSYGTACENIYNTDYEANTVKDSVNFKNGIHIHSKNGDKVDIGFGGIHVNDKNGTKVKIDSTGIFVNDEDGKVYNDDNGHIHLSNKNNENKHKSIWYMLPYPIIVVIAFLIWGFCGGWAVSWILFLTIPLYYTLIDAIVKRNPNIFAFPVLIVAIYLWIGLAIGFWHPYWILFLLIPVYYCICDIFKKSKK